MTFISGEEDEGGKEFFFGIKKGGEEFFFEVKKGSENFFLEK